MAARSNKTTVVAPAVTESDNVVTLPAAYEAVHVPESFVPNTGIPGEYLNLYTLPAPMVAYLIQYGLSKSMQDAASGTKAKAVAAHVRAAASSESDAEFESFCEDAGIEPDAASVMSAESFADSVVRGQKLSRLESIRNATIGQSRGGPTGPRVSTLDREVARVVREELTGIAARGKVKLPKGPAYQEMTARYLAKHGDRVRAEAQRRLDSTSDLDLSDLMGDLPI